MKHLKLFESFKEEDIHSICQKYGIEDYTINEDGSIDIDENVDLVGEKLTKLPLHFRNVSGEFYCAGNNLTTLEGCPKSVGDSFDCSNNKLTSLEGCPKLVCDDFYCDRNKITTFEHLPLLIGGQFYCDDNPIYNVWKLFKNYSKIEFLNDCDALRKPDADSEEPIIILDRLNYFLEELGKPTVTEVKGYKCI